MKNFLHFSKKTYVRRVKFLLGLVLFPLFLCSVILVLVIIINMRTFFAAGYFFSAVRVISFAVLFGMFYSWVILSLKEKYSNRHSEYTFIDIGFKEIVYSKYNGEYIREGLRIVLREVYVIPIGGLSALAVNEKNGKLVLECREKPIKMYSDKNERLTYSFKSDRVVFDNWWYNENGFSEKDKLVIPKYFGNADSLSSLFVKAKKRFDELPAPKKYVHKEAAAIKRKKLLKVLESELENLKNKYR